MTEKEFVMMSQLTDNMAAKMFAGMSWNKMLEVRSEFTRALDQYAKTHKGNIAGLDQIQLEALGAVARFDRLLRTYYFNTNKNHPRFFGVNKSAAKKTMIGEFSKLTKKMF